MKECKKYTEDDILMRIEGKKSLLKEMREHHVNALKKTENEKAMLCHTFFIKYIDTKYNKYLSEE